MLRHGRHRRARRLHGACALLVSRQLLERLRGLLRRAAAEQLDQPADRARLADGRAVVGVVAHQPGIKP